MSVPSLDAPVPRPAAWELPGAAEASGERRSRVVDYVALRVTGLVLSVLVLGHFVVTHVVNDVAQDNATFVARRLSSAVWIAWDSVMLAAALLHGVLGLRIALADYVSPRRRRALETALTSVAAALLVIGAFAIARVAHV